MCPRVVLCVLLLRAGAGGIRNAQNAVDGVRRTLKLRLTFVGRGRMGYDGGGVRGGLRTVATVHVTRRSTHLLRLLGCFVPDNPVDGADGRYIVLIADAISEQPIPNLPGEHGRILFFVIGYGIHHFRRRHLRFAAPDHPRLY
ncbi:hypothetical protein X975_04433, partial [Stegodyphus mimosarum]